MGSSISRLGGLLDRSDRLGSVVYDWVEVGLPSGIDAGTLLRMKTTIPDQYSSLLSSNMVLSMWAYVCHNSICVP